MAKRWVWAHKWLPSNFLAKLIQTFNTVIRMNEVTTEMFEAIQDTCSVIYQALNTPLCLVYSAW